MPINNWECFTVTKKGMHINFSSVHNTGDEITLPLYASIGWKVFLTFWNMSFNFFQNLWTINDGWWQNERYFCHF